MWSCGLVVLSCLLASVRRLFWETFKLVVVRCPQGGRKRHTASRRRRHFFPPCKDANGFFYTDVVYGRGRTKRPRKFDEMRAVFPFGREHTSGVRGASGRGPVVYSISLVEFFALDGGRNIKLVSCRGWKELAVFFFFFSFALLLSLILPSLLP